jgi:hypothetical protein
MVIPLVRDGVLVAAAEEERFRRVKHWAGLPAARELSQRSRELRAPSCQRKAAKNAGGLSGEGQAVFVRPNSKKRPFSLTQNQLPKTGKVAADLRDHTRTHP